MARCSTSTASFTAKSVYFDDLLIHRRYLQPSLYPSISSETENRAIALTGIAPKKPFMALLASNICDLHLCGAGVGAQCFPLYTYDADGGHRRDNVTDWALEQFRVRYPQAKITKKEIFHYVYAMLHHPVYRTTYAANLRRELPRIPLAPDFAAFAKAGAKLADLHVGYESQKEFKLKRVEMPGAKPDWRVERMKLSKDKTTLVYNDWLTLEGIPTEVSEYRLGNRSALEWVIDQYCVERSKTDPEEITSDPNRSEDEEYIVRLIGQVVTVSVETMKLVRALPVFDDSPVARGCTQAELDAAHVYVAEDASVD
jgi:predicted helicase